VLTPLYDGLPQNHHLPHASSLCGACQAACPVKIQIPDMLIKLREKLHHEPQQKKSRLESLAYYGWAKSLRSPWLFGLATWLATRTIGRFKRHQPWFQRLPGQLSGWTQKRDFPAPAPQRFRDWWRQNQESELP
jgi:L-lactate dehydrogenase complex protein LldF